MRKLSFPLHALILLACSSSQTPSSGISPDPSGSSGGPAEDKTSDISDEKSSDNQSPGQTTPQGPDDGGAVSGARLKATYVATPDGAKQFVGWSDPVVGLCKPAIATDGVLRCMPPVGFMGYVPGNAYADPQCTVPAAFMTNEAMLQSGMLSDPKITYALIGPTSVLKYFLLGKKLQTTTFYIKFSDTNCAASSGAWAVWERLGEVPITTFPPMTLQVDN